MIKRARFLDIATTALVGAGIIAVAWVLGEFPSEAIRRPGVSELSYGLPVFLLLFVLFSGLERIIPAVPHKPLEAWLLNLRIGFLYTLAGIASGLLYAFVLPNLSQRFNLGLIDLRLHGAGLMGLIGAQLLGIVIGDFFFYWFHRLEHKSAILWQEHKVHHMDEHVNAGTALRVHWITPFVQTLLQAVPMMILFKLDDVDPIKQAKLLGVLGFLVAIIPQALNVFIHSNIKIGFGRLGFILGSPQLHRIHHSRLPEHRDRNFATTFMLWDVLFGTYCPARAGEFPPTGVQDETEVRSLGEAALLPLRGWLRMFRDWRRGGSVPA